MFPHSGTIGQSGTASACRGPRLRSRVGHGDTPRQADAVPLSQTRCLVVFHTEDLNVALSSEDTVQNSIPN